MSLLKDFRDFVAKGNVLDLAVAVVIGAAFGKIITAVVDGLVMPLVGAILPGGDWRQATFTSLNFQIGAVLGATIDFLLVGLVLFLIVKQVMARIQKPAKPAEEKPIAKECPECLEQIPLKAKRCKYCTSVQTA